MFRGGPVKIARRSMPAPQILPKQRPCRGRLAKFPERLCALDVPRRPGQGRPAINSGIRLPARKSSRDSSRTGSLAKFLAGLRAADVPQQPGQDSPAINTRIRLPAPRILSGPVINSGIRLPAPQILAKQRPCR
jgi:hypothetical protein